MIKSEREAVNLRYSLQVYEGIIAKCQAELYRDGFTVEQIQTALEPQASHCEGIREEIAEWETMLDPLKENHLYGILHTQGVDSQRLYNRALTKIKQSF